MYLKECDDHVWTSVSVKLLPLRSATATKRTSEVTLRSLKIKYKTFFFGRNFRR